MTEVKAFYFFDHKGEFKITSSKLKRYLPEEVPDHLFTQKKLNRMGLASTTDHVSYVVYPEQKSEYKLFDINFTRERKKQKGFSLVVKDMAVKQILNERKRELEVRKEQFSK